MHDKWRTTISAEYKRKCVWRASFFGGLGVAALVAGGSFMPVEQLSLWGLPLLASAGALIFWSMKPYKEIVRMEDKPDELWINEHEQLIYSPLGQPLLAIPLASMQKSFFIVKPTIYGIAITLKNPVKEKIRIFNTGLDFKTLQRGTIKQYGCDIFLPFFSKRTFEDIME